MFSSVENHEKTSITLPVILLVVVVGAGIYVQRNFYHDDAYITLRYAQNWIDGNGLTWNVNEKPVEGFTSFLHLACLSVLGIVGMDLQLASQCIGLGALAGIIFYSWRYSKTQNNACDQMCLMLIPSSFGITAWAIGGLETTLFILLLQMACWQFAASTSPNTKQSLATGLLFGAAALTRPEAGLFWALAVLFTPAMHRKTWKPSLVGLITGFMVLAGLYVCWRWSYFGEWLPNTYHAKLAGLDSERLQDGFHYLHTFVRTPAYLLVLAAGMTLQHCYRKTLSASVLYMFASMVIFCCYIVFAGGDHMPAHRMLLVTLVPATWLINSRDHERCPFKINGNNLATIIFAIALLQIWLPITPGQWLENTRHADRAAVDGRDVGIWLEANEPESLIAVNTAGSTPYFAASHHFIDMLGLNDATIARRDVSGIKPTTQWQELPGHGKGDGDYVLSRNPDLIILGPALGVSMADPWFLTDIELADSPAFKELYEEDIIQFTGQSGKRRILRMYRRKQ